MASSASAVPSRSSRKRVLWAGLFAAALFVLVFSELPLLHTGTMYDAYRSQILKDRLLLIPHALCGVIALLLGPPQFFTRLRARNLALHRWMGRTYVYSVFVAAPFAVAISWGRPIIVGTCVQAGAWVVCKLAALLTARNRQMVQHRQWMVRSYALTFTFISLRVLNPWPRYWNLNDAATVYTILTVTFLSVLLPDIAFSWREITTRRG